MGGSSNEAKEIFLNMVGFTEASIEVQNHNVFSDEMAEIISTAELILDHNDVDPYFTPQQWALHCNDVELSFTNFVKLQRKRKSPQVNW